MKSRNPVNKLYEKASQSHLICRLTLLTDKALTFGMTESLLVNLNERSYEIHFGQQLSDEIQARVRELRAAGHPVAVLCDRNVAQRQETALTAMFGDAPKCMVTAGEGSKSLAGLGEVLEFLAENRVDRGGVLFAVGGGVIGDLGGFAAASYLRGIAFHQVPTTLLAMVDSSVGGKTGINLAAGFHQPRGVYIATDLLRTLPPREFAAGMAEVVKYGLLAEAPLFARLERGPLTVASDDLATVIRRCCAIKARIVEADERELAKEGGRALLNLGHTFGHAIEHAAGYGHYLHGEAIAIGLVAAAQLSHRLGLIPGTAIGRIEKVLAAHALPVRLSAPLPLGVLMAAMARDKKVRAGLPRFVVMQRIGEAVTRDGVSAALAEECFRAVGAV